MNCTHSFIGKGLWIFLALFFVGGSAYGQNLVIGADASFTGAGTYNVKGNIDNSAKSSATTITGTMNLNGGGAQAVGTATNGAINFNTLNASGGSAKTLNVNSAVSAALTSDGAGTIFDIGTRTLTISGTISASNSGVYDFAEATSTVTYDGAAQALFGTDYGILNISGSGTNTMQGAITAIGAVTQSNGTLTVGQNFTVNTASASSFATLNTVSATKTLLNSGAGTTSIATLSANAGTVEATGGKLQFTTAVTNDAGSIKGTGAALDFDVDITNAGGTIALNSTGTATFAGNFTSQGTLTFPSGSIVTYDGAAQNVPGVSYGVLRTAGTAASTKTASEAITVLDAFDNGGTGNVAVTTDFSTFTHTLPAYANLENTNGTVKFGGTDNGYVFGTGTVEYNRAGDQTIRGHAANTYATLIFSGSGIKLVADADANVLATAGVTVPVGIELKVEATRSLQVGITAGDLTVNGSLTNAGTVTVGS